MGFNSAAGLQIARHDTANFFGTRDADVTRSPSWTRPARQPSRIPPR